MTNKIDKIKKLVKELDLKEHTKFDNWYKMYTKNRWRVPN